MKKSTPPSHNIVSEKRCPKCGDRLRPDLFETEFCTNCQKVEDRFVKY